MMTKHKLIILFLVTSTLYSQADNIIQNIIKSRQSINTVEQNKLNKAKSHDRAGLVNEANLIYSQLFNENQSSKATFSAYKIFLKKHKKWDELINLSEIYAKNILNSHIGKLELADSYLIVGKDEKAYVLFDELFQNYTDEIKVLKHFISKLIYNNKTEYAKKRIAEIRINYNQPDFYSIDLGMIYFSRMEYDKSLDEYILYLSYNTDHMDLVRSKLMAFPINDNYKSMIQKKLKSSMTEISNIILAEYYFTWKNYKEAYEIMIKNYIDEKSLYDFAIDMMLADELNYAEKILSHLLKSNNKNMVELSIYQLATILENKSQQQISKLPISDKFIRNSFSQINQNTKIDLETNSIKNAIHLYDSLIINFDNIEAKFKLAKLNSLITTNYQKSISDFEDLEKKSKNKEIQFLSSIKIIELNILNNKINQELIDKIKKYKKKYNKAEQQALLDLKLNLTYFYNKEFEKVSENLNDKLKKISKESPYYNDYLDGLMIIMLFNNNHNELSKLSDAYLNMEQRNIDIALELLRGLKESENEVVSNLSSYYRSYIYIYRDQYELAFKEIELMNGKDIFYQLSQLLLAEVKDYIDNDINSAIDMYLYFLENYESSIYYEDIRLRLRELIG